MPKEKSVAPAARASAGSSMAIGHEPNTCSASVWPGATAKPAAAPNPSAAALIDPCEKARERYWGPKSKWKNTPVCRSDALVAEASGDGGGFVAAGQDTVPPQVSSRNETRRPRSRGKKAPPRLSCVLPS